MTRRTNARIAGFTFLFYIAVAAPAMVLFNKATSGEGIAAKLATIAQHSTDLRIVVLLFLLGCFSALVLAVTLYSLTREVDRDLAVLGMICRVAEGILSATSVPTTLALLWLATTGGPNGAGASALGVPNALDPAAAHTLAAYLLRDDMALTATFFAVGSTLFAYLFLRGRMIPRALAWIGIVASVLLDIGLPLQLAGVLGAPITSYIYIPMFVFEISLGLWLIIKGVAAPTR